MIHIEIGRAEKIENLVMDIPVFAAAGAAAEEPAAAGEKRVIRTLVKKHIRITDVEIGSETAIRDGKITIDGSIVEKAVLEDPLCKSMKLDVIKPENRHVYTETIMDVCPIATKVEGELGSGVTKVADGVVFMLTGVDEDGDHLSFMLAEGAGTVYVISWEYPAEAAEGFGVRLEQIAGTFEVME